MRVSMVTQAAPGQVNEDFVGATAHAAVLLDGAGLSGVDDGGCRHGVSWYAHHLGGQLLARLADEPEYELAEILADAIDEVANSHRVTCDLSHPGTPSSTVVIARLRETELDYLVLADSVLLLDGHDGQRVICDDREAVIGRDHRATMDVHPNGSAVHDEERKRYVATLRSYRNLPGGFWVAAADPDAAAHSVTGTATAEGLRSVTLLSDGASRLVDRFDTHTWPQALSMIATTGLEALIHAVRDAERSDPHGRRWPRGKIHDDASIAHCDQLQPPPVHPGQDRWP